MEVPNSTLVFVSWSIYVAAGYPIQEEIWRRSAEATTPVPGPCTAPGVLVAEFAKSLKESSFDETMTINAQNRRRSGLSQDLYSDVTELGGSKQRRKDMSVQRPGNAIFILGVTTRSGTNFLSGLLKLHPDCRRPEPIWEDYLLEQSHLLIQYAQATYGRWKSHSPPWGVDQNFEGLLCQHLGEALLSFLGSRAGQGRLLTKTPYISNLNNFFKLFPDAYLLILVRDGRDVVESAARSFEAWRDGMTRQWANAAEKILRFDRANRARNNRYMIIRYEDLYVNLDDELPKILEFLDLDTEVYDFDAARELPVRGSSTHRGEKDHVHWEEPVAKTSDFKPICRWESWDRLMHERFNWIAGQYLTDFGYEMRSYANHRLTWGMYNRVVDAIGKHRPDEQMPSWIWEFLKKAGYGLFRLAGVDAHRKTHEDA